MALKKTKWGADGVLGMKGVGGVYSKVEGEKGSTQSQSHRPCSDCGKHLVRQGWLSRRRGPCGNIDQQLLPHTIRNMSFSPPFPFPDTSVPFPLPPPRTYRKAQQLQNSPFKSPEHDTRLDLLANPLRPARTTRMHHAVGVTNEPVQLVNIVIEYRERDEGREPEQHGQRIEGEDGEDVGEGGEEARGEGEVDEDEERPDGGEDHEVYPGWGCGVGHGCDCGGGKLADIEGVGAAFWRYGSWSIGHGERRGEGRERRTMAGETNDYDREEELEGANDEDDGVEHGELAG